MTTKSWFPFSPNAAIASSVAILAVATSAAAAPVFNIVSYTPTATASNVTINQGGDHAGFGLTAPFGTSTSYMPVLATINSNFIVGNFDGTAPTNQTFQTAFNAWNAANGGNWTLINGGDLNVTLSVTDTASASQAVGGINPLIVDVTMNAGYTGPTLSQLVWTQALYISYTPQGAVDLSPPANTLDTYSFNKGSGGAFNNPAVPIPGQTPGPNNTTPSDIPGIPTTTAYNDPIYPFVFDDKHFGDAPMGFWPDESFRGIALLSTVTFMTNAAGAITARDLTVYDGVSYGFDLSVPEPSSYLMLASGLAGLLGLVASQLRTPTGFPKSNRQKNRPTP